MWNAQESLECDIQHDSAGRPGGLILPPSKNSLRRARCLERALCLEPDQAQGLCGERGQVPAQCGELEQVLAPCWEPEGQQR